MRFGTLAHEDADGISVAAHEHQRGGIFGADIGMPRAVVGEAEGIVWSHGSAAGPASPVCGRGAARTQFLQMHPNIFEQMPSLLLAAYAQ